MMNVAIIVPDEDGRDLHLGEMTDDELAEIGLARGPATPYIPIKER